MPNRSSRDPNEQAHSVVSGATEDEDATGPELLADFIATIREADEDDATDEDLALRLWPRFRRMVALAASEQVEEIQRSLQEWQESRHSSAAAELGRKGGRKGGKARAARLSAERKSEIARKAARARWGKKGDDE